MNTLVPIKPRNGECSICETPQSIIGMCKATGLSYGACCSKHMAYATNVIDSYMLNRGFRHPQPGDDFGQD